MEAKLHHGSPIMVDYTPGADVAAGQVVVQGDVPMVAHLDIASGRKGALALAGGVYQVVANGAIGVLKRVFWDDTNNKISLSPTAGKPIGWTLTAAAADGDLVYLWHQPGDASAEVGQVADAIADPGASGAIPVTATGRVPIVTAGAETRTLAAPTFAGQELLVYMKTDGGDAVITCATAVNQTGNNTITMNDVGDSLRLHAIESGSSLRWRVVCNDGCTLATV